MKQSTEEYLYIQYTKKAALQTSEKKNMIF